MNTKTKQLLMVLALGAMVAIAGCVGAEEDVNRDGEQLANDSGKDVSGVQPGESYQFEIKLTEKNQKRLVIAQPPPQMDHSLERQNLINRYEYLNDKNNVHHVYLMDEGQVVAYYVAQGKVSSVNSKLTNDKQIIATKQCIDEKDNGGNGADDDETNCYKAVESPQMDGSYGSNGDAIFFFTTSGDYVESSLDYVVSEEPRNIQDEVILKENVGDDEDDTNGTATNSSVPN